MYINTFVNTYGAKLPPEQVMLLRAAAAYYKHYVDTQVPANLKAAVVDPFYTGYWRLDADIELGLPATGGTTEKNPDNWNGGYVIRLPINETAGSPPVAGVGTWADSTFAMYDARV